MDAAFERAVLAQLMAIPPGQVSTYGTLAALAGYPRHARHVGKLLGNAPAGAGWPWFRVVSGSGKVARPGTAEADYQILLLEEDGVEVGPGGRVNLRRYGWPAQYFIP
ncbi:MGMT family protein [Vogesella sp. GCM10023246]|uniref:MGMT family protein n=1 Tax=Vogesella oryzagri TaxID=3160864 RepID=A0ABV1M763_9NEIS